jgi:energy-coupling factor transporter ATP-binding protein EcfA2
MKLTRVLLRWYKSFHLNYRGTTGRGEAKLYRPWNKISPPFAPKEEFPFIEIPIEDDITSVVGANESGKSHLLNAISKVIRGTGIEVDDEFKRTDLCHYSGIRTRNVEAWPNIGLQFRLTDADELARLRQAVGVDASSGTETTLPTFTLLLAPDADNSKPARVFIEPNETEQVLDKKQLTAVRKLLPSVQFIDSKAQLSSEIAMTSLLAAYGEEEFVGLKLTSRRKVEEAMSQLSSLPVPVPQQVIADDFITGLQNIKRSISSDGEPTLTPVSLEMQLFKEILDINVETIRYIYNLSTDDRGYIEGQIAKWNDEINDKLNLSHFWRQDEQFRLSVNYKDGIIYFEIRDKTDSIYTFRERSSGLKYFLSYYIQAKAMELSSRNRNSIILMDEPDSALSILGQRNLLSVFESLVSPESSNQTCQLIYTTHSPYLINRNFPRRIRVVKKEDAEEGTQYIEQARARRYEPVRTALGIDSAPSLFLGEDNVLVEGATDQYLLTELIRVFATPTNVGEFLDLNAVIFVSADGVANIESVLEQSRWADEPIPPTALVVDSDQAAIDAIAKITSAGKGSKLIDRDFVLQVGDVVNGAGSGKTATSEDLVPVSLYVEAVEGYLKRWLPDTWTNNAAAISSDLQNTDYGKDGVVESTKNLFAKYKPIFKTDYDKMGVLQELILIVTSRHQKDENNADVQRLRENVIAVCDFIREALEKSRASTAKASATQRVKRIISDFDRLNKQNVPITALENLFRRLNREVAPIGTDGEDFLKLVNVSLAELASLRSAGQERISGDLWTSWHTRIMAIKKNLLTATTNPPATSAASVVASAKTTP